MIAKIPGARSPGRLNFVGSFGLLRAQNFEVAPEFLEKRKLKLTFIKVRNGLLLRHTERHAYETEPHDNTQVTNLGTLNITYHYCSCYYYYYYYYYYY